jgi:hypothetical protein
MNKEFVNYNQALKLKELGFDEPCFGWYQSSRLKKEYDPLKNSGNQSYQRKEDCNAPTFSQAFRWFRDKRGLVSWISFRIDLKKKYLWYITDVKNIAARDGDYIFDILIESYEEAELACLKKLIEIANEQR